MKDISEELTFAVHLVKEAGATFTAHFGVTHTEWKADNTPLTEADTSINELVIRRISERYPGDRVYGEEASNDASSHRVWVVDPIDGTQPFENGIPVSTIVVALIDAGVPQLAAVYDPVAGDLYTAERGKGAYKNEQKIACNKSDQVAAHYFATSSFHPDHVASVGTVHDRIEAHKGKVFNFRSFTYSAMKVAEGKLSGAYLGVGRLYDTVAPALIIEEAGGRATDLTGQALSNTETSDGIVVSNGALHQQLLQYLQK